MQGFNHVAGGLAFTGIFASFADINLFSKPEYIAVTVAASLLADVDHTRSIPGKIFYPLAKWLDKKYGHRTVTHCLLFYLAAVAVVGIFEMLLFPGQRVYTLFFALGYGSHLIFDMCTRQGIPLFMPFTRARCVLPGNPNLRLSNKNITGEIVVFFGFAGLLFTTLPLMANGFWTSYNKAFATFAHVQREFDRSKDVIFLQTKEGPAGSVISATATGAVIFTGNIFKQLDNKKYSVASFRHTRKAKNITRLEFQNIAADSLRKILAKPIIAGLFNSTGQIEYKENGVFLETNAKKLQYSTGFIFREIAPDNTQTQEKINRLKILIAENEQAINLFRKEQQAKAAQLASLQNKFAGMSEYEQGKAIENIASLKSELAAAKIPETRPEVIAAHSEILSLREYLSNQSITYSGYAEIWKQ